MVTKGKKTAAKVAPKKAATSMPAPRAHKPVERAPHTEAYDAALGDYTAALELLRKGDYTRALEQLRTIAAANPSEPELMDRARTYAAFCERRLTPGEDPPRSADDAYYRGIVRANEGRLDEAAALLDRALREEPEASRYLYARASIRALQGRTDAAVADLRRAVAGDSHLRYQASNDPDFDRVRDDAAFIDVIEPTSSGS